MMTTTLLYGLCAVVYTLLSALILVQARLSRTGVWMAAATLATAAWGAAGAAAGAIGPFAAGAPGSTALALDLLQSVVWYGFILHLYRRSLPADGGARQRGGVFVTMGLVAILMSLAAVLLDRAAPSAGSAAGSGAGALSTIGVATRLGLAVCKLLLLENLYRNTQDEARWHINLVCVALGGLSVYEIVIGADIALFRTASPTLADGRAIVTTLVAPLLAVAAVRNRSWRIDIHVSRTAAFHSATLIASGVLLLSLAAAGEAVRRFGPAWGGVAEISLVFAGAIAVAVLLTSASLRGRLRGLVVDHFFSHRYDYRREWLRCIDTLSADGHGALHRRVIRAVADVVDSPGGALFLREGAAFQWAGSWNMPAAAASVPADHPLVAALRDGAWIAERPALAGFDAWLAAPLARPTTSPGAGMGAGMGARLDGFVLLAPPRAAFRLDREVFELLRILGREVASYIAEQRATETLMQARQLHDYGKRFAFVAHDIKNVSSQLSLLLSNAEIHIDNPEFQRDMLVTVRASVDRIGGLLKRLQGGGADAGTPAAPQIIRPAERVEAILSRAGVAGAGVAGAGRRRGIPIDCDDDGADAAVAMEAGAFDAVLTHLVTNAIEASAAGAPVRIAIRHEARRVAIEVADQGHGMTAEFVRDQLFRPFATSKRDGSGIGAYQARELLREAGGDLQVTSAPGAGTTMRILLPLADSPAAVGGIAPATAQGG